MKRKKYLEAKKNKPKKLSRIILLFLVVFIVISIALFCFLWIKVSNLNKFTFVNKNTDSDITEIYVVGRNSSDVKKYTIDENIMVDSSYGYGEYSIKNLWKLSEKENYGGDIISKSITKNFSIPVHYFINQKRSNMDIFHKIKANVAMKQSRYEQPRTIESTGVPKSILVDFINNEIQENEEGVEIEDLSGSSNLSNNISDVINVIGSKVVNYSRGYDKELDCEVVGNNQSNMLNQISIIFNCQKVYSQDHGNNVKLRIGEKFLSRF